jgi:hypothetical protein
MYEHCFNKLPDYIRSSLKPPTPLLISFSGERSYPGGVVTLELTIGTYPLSRIIMLQFHIVKPTSNYNVILGRLALQKLSMEVSSIRSLVEFQTGAGVATVISDYP